MSEILPFLTSVLNFFSKISELFRSGKKEDKTTRNDTSTRPELQSIKQTSNNTNEIINLNEEKEIETDSEIKTDAVRYHINVPVEKIFEFLERNHELTEFNLKKMTEKYIGKWLKCNVVVWDIGEDIQLNGEKLMIVKGYFYPCPSDIDCRQIFVSFSFTEWEEHLALIDREQQISVEGKIKSISDGLICLVEGELDL